MTIAHNLDDNLQYMKMITPNTRMVDNPQLLNITLIFVNQRPINILISASEVECNNVMCKLSLKFKDICHIYCDRIQYFVDCYNKLFVIVFFCLSLGTT